MRISQEYKDQVNSSFSENALKMMGKRYLMPYDEGGQETPADMFERVANALAHGEKTYGKSQEAIARIAQDFFAIMASKEYTPAGRTLTNAGGETPLIANCIVLRIEDSMESIFQTLKEAALLQQAGCGLGFDLSEMRPANSPTKKSRGRASGPVTFLTVYDKAFATIKQQCFAKGTRIITKRGLVPIQEVRVGDETFTEKGWKKVAEVFSNGVRDTIKLTLDSGFEIELTPEHKVAVIKDGKIALRQAKELTGEDVLVMKLGDETHDFERINLEQIEYQKSKYTSSQLKKIKQPAELTEDLAYLLGWYFADGHNTKEGISVAIPDADDIETRFGDLLRSLFGLSFSVRKTRGENCRKAYVFSRTLKRFLSATGLSKQHAWEIEVPEKILRSPGSVQRAFIAGFFDGDGDNGRNYRLNTSSKIFAQQLHLMLLANGIGTKIKQEQRRENWRVVYRLGIIGKNSTHRFYEKLSQHSWKIQKKEETKDFGWIFPFHPVHDLGYSWLDIKRLHDGVRSTISHSVLSQIQARAILQQAQAVVQEKIDWTGFLPVKVKSVEKAGEQEVYDFEVEDVHMINAGLYTKNSRHGANMAMMRVDHPDVLDFISCKEQEGEIRNFNISVTVTDEFMRQLEESPNTQWWCQFNGKKMKPRKVLRYPNGSVYDSQEADITVQELFDTLVEHAWQNGEPGIAFVDTWNRANPLPDLGPLAATNPCVTGDTLVATEKGLLRMEELVKKYGEQELGVVVDKRVPATMDIAVEKRALVTKEGEVGETPVFYAVPRRNTGRGNAIKAWGTGTKPVYKLMTHSGYALEATQEHKIFTPTGKIPLGELKKNDKILLQSTEGLWSQDKKLPFEVVDEMRGKNGRIYRYNFPKEWTKELGQVLGWLIGDGWLRDKPKQYAVGFTFSREDGAVMKDIRKVTNQWRNLQTKPILRHNGVYHLIYGSKNFVDYLKSLGIRSVKAAEKEVPHTLWQAPREAVVGFLQGLFSADGTIQLYEKNQTRYIRLTSKSEKLLKQVQLLLANLGIRSTIYNRSRKPSVKMGYQNDGICFELQISKVNISVFLEKVGFLGTHYTTKVDALKTQRDAKRGYYQETFEDEIREISYIGRKKVYDLTEETTHSFIANGIVISNCGEQALQPYDNCNLGSINLAKFVKAKEVDWDRLRFVTRTAVRLMDNVIDLFDFPVPQVTELAQKNRRIGLGIMGFGDMLYQLGVRYDSAQGLAAAEQVMGFINEESYAMSQELAQEKGIFPNYEKSVFSKEHAPHSTAQDPGIGKPMRNAALTTVAPTGSISMMFDTSSGVEPNFALAYVKQDKDGQQYRYFNKYFQEALDKLELSQEQQKELMDEIMEKGSIQGIAWLPQEIRDTFVVAMDISGKAHMEMQAAFQKHVDNSISKTINFPNSATRKEVAESFVSAWKLGCKSATVYRDGSRQIQILNVGSGDHIVSTTENPGAVRHPAPEKRREPEGVVPRKRPEVMNGKTYRMKTGYGNLYITINDDEEGKPFEVFATIGKSGGFFQEQSEAICRLSSLALRAGIRVEEVMNDLKGIRGPMPIFTEKGTVLSLPDAIGRVLEEHVTGVKHLQDIIDRPENQEVFAFAKEEGPSMADFGFMPGCPDCGSQLIMAEGCISCKACGFSRCS